MRKGAISPIADDIPSIFPIVASVLLFLGAVAYAGGVINERNNYLEIRKAGLGLSDVVLAKGYLGNDDFKSQCSVSYTEFAKRKSVKFFISLKKFCRYVDFSSAQNPFVPVTRYNGVPPNDYSVTGLVCPTSGVVGPSGPPTKNFQSLVFPVAVDCKADGSQKGLGVVTLVVWR
ncbi:hypothetical protein HY995_05065 [Candidatus Micrarchaeota archaeon]|nr:hypothetical protein [Candidatus Micrarchaeota archaeon]